MHMCSTMNRFFSPVALAINRIYEFDLRSRVSLCPKRRSEKGASLQKIHTSLYLKFRGLPNGAECYFFGSGHIKFSKTVIPPLSHYYYGLNFKIESVSLALAGSQSTRKKIIPIKNRGDIDGKSFLDLSPKIIGMHR